MLWLCIQFSYNPTPSARYDLRIIPLVLGALYIGIGPILIGSIIIIRGFYGFDLGFYLTMMLYAPLTVVFWRLYPWFLKQVAARRILVTVCMGITLGILTVIGMSFAHPHSNWLDAWIAFLFLPSLGIGIISYGIEFVRRNNEMQQELIKAEKLKAVEQMGAAISHEIRNPLTAASGFVQLLQDDYLSRQKRKEYLSIVKEELISAERVIQDYLTFAKPSLEAFEELNVKSELRQIINILQPLANQNSVEVNTDFSVIGFIKGDLQKFRQCFVNVLKNAIESMPNGGYLTITTEYSKNFVTISVKDTGVGMTIEQLERLGEPFYSTKGKNGTGLGMMVVYSIARAMDGTIWAESEIGVGTTFYFKFPTISSMMKSENIIS
ncbi:HAMP domain-containing sensor histidine kinase [Neobacillus sp. OS1-33]|uniref:HAMP domain-containing sensor histidine kinase n=1 Tax=Neobacillus sp. OS1-33 TaxID=3070683 RepID=UPI0027E0CE42|nr:HAMP domain-containing sensor histidine kinase [Neobacillus sp. OS1-33]WML27985.1 HAMP domain-containing sensor histidine kinase [Neobacillus sp. OS1-33]